MPDIGNRTVLAFDFGTKSIKQNYTLAVYTKSNIVYNHKLEVISKFKFPQCRYHLVQFSIRVSVGIEN